MIYPVTRELVLVMPVDSVNLRLAEFIKSMTDWLAMQEEITNQRLITVPTAVDAEDVRLSRNGDGHAYRRLVEAHQKYIGQLMWRFSRDRQVHEELVQDVFVEAYFSLANFNEKAPFTHWLAKIATRVGYRFWKQEAKQKQTENFSVQEWDEIADKIETIDPGKAASLVHRMLSKLPPRDRLVLTL